MRWGIEAYTSSQFSLYLHPAVRSKQGLLERHTRMNLLYAILSDEFLPFITKQFQQELDDRLEVAYDSQNLIDLYNHISEAVGEPLMETLNLRLKQRFLLAPLATVFAQGVTNDLLYCLTNRDSETSKQMFQLLLMPEGKEGS